MAISQRLHSPMDKRPDEDLQELPKRIVFLSVEGNNTEKHYFNYIQKYRNRLNIEAVVHIETLSRRSQDTCSDPESVYELLMDCLKLRSEGILPEDIYSKLDTDSLDITIDDISKFLNDELPSDESHKISSAIRMANISLEYQNFLSNFCSKDNNDVFAIIIDRDCYSHTEDQLKALFENCKANNFHCFLTNPCFEFWLLLHICDIYDEYSGNFQDLLFNQKVSHRHTYISSELSQRAGHSKSISDSKFVDIYLPNVDLAIERAKKFDTDNLRLLNNLGSSIPKLFEILREKI